MRATRSGRAARLALSLVPALLASAQTQSPKPTPKPFTLEVEVDLVSVTAVVFDKAGRFIRGLGPSDVEVFEDGVRQEVSFFREAAGGEDKIPLSVVLVLDASGSMKSNMHFLQDAATTFLHKLEDVDKAMVVQFNSTIKGSAEFSDDVDRLDQFIEALQAWGGTSLFDAVHYSLGRIKDQPGRKAIVVFSDGDDTSSMMKKEDVVAYARAVEATVYTVGIGRGAKGFLKDIAAESGGQSFFPDRVADLIKVFNEIALELHNHYALAYTPKRPADGSFRAIQVKLASRKDAEIRVRKGYFAVKRRPAAN